jgi:hypothetical protein
MNMVLGSNPLMSWTARRTDVGFRPDLAQPQTRCLSLSNLFNLAGEQETGGPS